MRCCLIGRDWFDAADLNVDGPPCVRRVPAGRLPLVRRLTDLDAGLGMVLSRSAVLAGWQCRQGVEMGLVQSDVGRGGVGGDLHFSFRADDRRGDRRAG
jgi:hypothetical protein